MKIELRLLKSFVAIYECGSMSRAAQRDYCSQAAMSIRLKMLEDEVGDRLFIRRHHRLEPTALGCEIYAKALRVLASYNDLMSMAHGRTGTVKVRIGLPDDYALAFIPRILHARVVERDRLEIEIVCDLSQNLLAAVQRQELDIALATVTAAPWNAFLVAEVELSWVHHPDWHLEHGVIPLAAYPDGCVFRRKMIDALEAARLPWRIVAESRSQAGVLSAVWGGIGVTAMVDGMTPPGLKALSSDEELPRLSRVPIYLARRSGVSSDAVASLEQSITEQLARISC